MQKVTRRTVLSGAAALGATAMTGAEFAPAKAAAPLSGKNATGFYRRKVGDIEVTWVLDEVIVRDVGPGIARAEIPEIQKTVSEVWADGKIRQPFVPLVVNNGSKLILLDTGTGNRSGNGMYMENFAAAGYDAKAVDVIVISHFHGDHIGGIRLKDESLAFPNAEILVPAPEWAFWMNDENMGKATTDAQKAGFANIRRIFKDLGDRVKHYEPGKEVVTNVTTIATPGHTVGHTSFVVSSGNQTLMTVADAATLEIFVRNTNLVPNADANPEQALATRRRLLDMAVTDKLLTTGYHWPFPGASYVFRDTNGYRLVSAT